MAHLSDAADSVGRQNAECDYEMPSRKVVSISTLPLEILSGVFTQTASDCFPWALFMNHGEIDCASFYSWTSLRSVCRLWNHVAITTPGLWKYVSIDFDRTKIEQLIQMSKMALLVVDITLWRNSGEKELWKDKADLLMSHCRRFSVLRILLRRPPIPPTANYINDVLESAKDLRAPRLSALLISYGGRWNLPPLTSIVLDRSLLPSLQNLALRGWQPPKSSSIYRNVRSLRLASARPGFTGEELTHIVRDSPLLEELILDNVDPVEGDVTLDGARASSLVKLPFLQTFTLNARYRSCAFLMRSLVFPDTLAWQVACSKYLPSLGTAADALPRIPFDPNHSQLSAGITIGINWDTLRIESVTVPRDAHFLPIRRTVKFWSVVLDGIDFRTLITRANWCHVTTTDIVIQNTGSEHLYDRPAHVCPPFADILTALPHLSTISLSIQISSENHVCWVPLTVHTWIDRDLRAFLSAAAHCHETRIDESGTETSVVCERLTEVSIAVTFGFVADERAIWTLLSHCLQNRDRCGSRLERLSIGGFVLNADDLERQGYHLEDHVGVLNIISTRED